MARLSIGTKTYEYFVLQVEYRSTAARRARFSDNKVSSIRGATALTIFDRFADVFVESQLGCDLPQFRRDPTLVRCEFAKRVAAPPLPPVRRAPFRAKGTPEQIVRDGYQYPDGKRLTGKGVYIAIPDTGVDFRHPDLISSDAMGNPHSRVDYFWDTTLEYHPGRGSRAPFAYPNGSSIGTVFANDELTANLLAAKNGSAQTIPEADTDGHGTACAGIAAGNGNSDKSTLGLKRNEVIGVAPDATIVAIRLGTSGSSLPNAYLLNAIYEWLDGLAADHPLVISSSFGGHYTGHDGQSVGERELDARLSGGNRKGRALVAAAGNDRNSSIHAKVSFGGIDKAAIVSWKAKRAGDINVFVNSSHPREIQIKPLPGTHITIRRFQLNRITNEVETSFAAPLGEGKIKILNSSGDQTEAHLYFPNESSGEFIAGVDSSSLVSTPGTEESVITVGSYDWNDNFNLDGNLSTLPVACKNTPPVPMKIGWLSCYSSPGPTRDKRPKPDIVAPGEWYTATFQATSHDSWTRDSTGMYVAMNGTSAATPYVAGIIALLFECDPTLTTNRIKELIRQNATKEGLQPAFGTLPNGSWGYGKLDLESIRRIFSSFEGAKP